MSDARRYRRRTLLGAAGALATVSCLPTTTETPSASPAPTETATPAPRGNPVTGTLAVYSALETALAMKLVAGFSAAYPGVRATLLPVAAIDELDTRIRVEHANRKGDVVLGGASPYHDALARDGFIEAYATPAAGQIPARLRDANGKWTGWYLDALAVIVNTDRFGKTVKNAPKTWDDLLDPEWKSQLVMPDPIRTDAGYALIATQYQRFGRDESKTIDYLRAIQASVLQYASDTADAVATVSRGEAAGTIGWLHDALADGARHSGLQVLVTADADVEIGAVSILKGTESLAAAHAFVDWTIGRDGEALIASAGGRVPTRALSPGPQGAPPLNQLDPTRYDRRAGYDVRERLLNRWRAIIG